MNYFFKTDAEGSVDLSESKCVAKRTGCNDKDLKIIRFNVPPVDIWSACKSCRETLFTIDPFEIISEDEVKLYIVRYR